MRKMDSITELMIWLVILIVVIIVSNTIFHIRTAASLFLGFLIASGFIFLFYQSLFGETVVMFMIIVGLIYAFSRAIRDKRDDRAAIEEMDRRRD